MLGYEVVRKLAEGSAAEVFLAQSAASGPVVLEILRSELTVDSEIYGRFLDIAKERQALVHPNLLHRRSTGCADDGRLFVVTEPVLGDHLGNLLVQHGRLKPAEVVRLMIPLCEAVEYLHARAIVHGHLRPSNVFLTGGREDPRPKLFETGLSLFRSTRSVPKPASMVLVEPEYLCPERIRGRRGDALSDVYGLGVLMYELLAGVPPFRSPDPLETRRQHLEEAPPPLPVGCERIGQVVFRCLAKSQSRRFPSADAVRQALAWYASTPAHGTVRLPPVEDEPLTADDFPIPANQLAPAPIPASELVVTRVTGGAPIQADDLVIAEATDAVVGNYELEQLLGTGGMGKVYRARHRMLGRKVALKILRPELARDPTQIQRFFQEARSVNRVSHPHIVEIHDFVEEPSEQGGRIYLVMELLEGGTLRADAAQAPFSIGRSVKIIRQVCQALGAAHQVGVIHRDVKPDNIFLIEREGKADYVKVLDFGIAKLRHGETGNPESTAAGLVLGTPAFMAPEQAMGDADHRADIYSVGTVLYAMLTGHTPFASAGKTGPLLRRLLTEPPPRPGPRSASGEPLAEALVDAVMRTLAKAPENRFQTMAELSDALRPFDADFIEAPAVILGIEESVAPAPPARKSHRRAWLLAGLLAVAAGGAWWLRHEAALDTVIEAGPPTVHGTAPVDPAAAKLKKHHR